jgi:hypothetical protein
MKIVDILVGSLESCRVSRSCEIWKSGGNRGIFLPFRSVEEARDWWMRQQPQPCAIMTDQSKLNIIGPRRTIERCKWLWWSRNQRHFAHQPLYRTEGAGLDRDKTAQQEQRDDLVRITSCHAFAPKPSATNDSSPLNSLLGKLQTHCLAHLNATLTCINNTDNSLARHASETTIRGPFAVNYCFFAL